MLIILLLILFTILILLICLFRKAKLNIVITIICSLLILQLIVTPKLCIDSSILGAKLFFYKVFPSLFSFLVISNIMLYYNGVDVYSRILGGTLCKLMRLPRECSFPLIISFLCGYPLGAKYSCDLYEKKLISYDTCQRLVNIASNASPIFIIGSVGTAMLGNTYLGYLLLLSNYLSCFVMGIIIPGKNEKGSSCNESKSFENSLPNIGDAIKDSLDNAIKSCLSIGSFVVLFSVIISIIKSNIIFDIAFKKLSSFTGISLKLVQGFTLGLVEMTNGCNIISSSNLEIYYKLIIISFMLSFSGLSIISQVYSFIYKYKFPMKKYISRKVVQGVICSILTILLYKLPIFNMPLKTFKGANSFSSGSIFILVIMIILLPTSIHHFKKLFHIP